MSQLSDFYCTTLAILGCAIHPIFTVLAQNTVNELYGAIYTKMFSNLNFLNPSSHEAQVNSWISKHRWQPAEFSCVPIADRQSGFNLYLNPLTTDEISRQTARFPSVLVASRKLDFHTSPWSMVDPLLFYSFSHLRYESK